ncbi:MAG: hypothetical protein MZV64_44850 [Ignavibacteriales bacterium]|nr:hypothetical protein [Ignavibacteriales bacterium]
MRQIRVERAAPLSAACHDRRLGGARLPSRRPAAAATRAELCPPASTPFRSCFDCPAPRAPRRAGLAACRRRRRLRALALSRALRSTRCSHELGAPAASAQLIYSSSRRARLAARASASRSAGPPLAGAASRCSPSTACSAQRVEGRIRTRSCRQGGPDERRDGRGAAAATGPLEEVVDRARAATRCPRTSRTSTRSSRRTEIEALPRLADDSLEGRASPARAPPSNGLVRARLHARRRRQRDAGRARRPAAVRAVPPAAAAEPDQRARPAASLSGLDVYAGGFTAEYGDRMSAVIDARSLRPGGRRLLRAGPEPVPRQRARLAALRGRAAGSGWRRSGAATSTRSRTSSTPTSASRATSTASRRLDYAFSPTRRAAACTCCCPATSAEVTEHRRARSSPIAELPQRRTSWAHARARLRAATERDARSFPTPTCRPSAPARSTSPGKRTGSVDDERRLRRARPEARRELPQLTAGCTAFGRRRAHASSRLRLREQRRASSRATRARGSPGAGTSATSTPQPSGEHFAAYCTQPRAGSPSALDRRGRPALGRADLRRRMPTTSSGRASTSPGSVDDAHAAARELGSLPAVPGHQRAAGRGRRRSSSARPQQRRPRDPRPRAATCRPGLTLRVEAYRKDYGDLQAALREPVRPAVAGARAALGPRRHRARRRPVAEGVELLLTRKRRRPVERLVRATRGRA